MALGIRDQLLDVIEIAPGSGNRAFPDLKGMLDRFDGLGPIGGREVLFDLCAIHSGELFAEILAGEAEGLD